MILAWTGDELSCRQAQNGVTFDFEVKFDLEGQGQSPPKTIGILTKVFYTYGPNLVILAWTGDELSRGQARDWRMDGHKHRQTQATTIPEGQNCPRVKTELFAFNPCHDDIQRGIYSFYHCAGEGGWNLSSLKTRTWLFWTVDNTADHDLMMQGAKWSVAIIYC